MPEPAQSPRVIRFGVFEADLPAGELRRDGLKVKLQERPFQVLTILLERAGEVVTREELRQRIWPADTFVDFDHSLNSSINKLRYALGDEADNPRFVATVGRRGYRFIAPVGEPNSTPGSGLTIVRTGAARTGGTTPLADVSETGTAADALKGDDAERWKWYLSGAALGAGRVRRSAFVVGLLLVVVGTSYFALRHFGPRAQPPAGRIMLAVLPFENLTGDPEQEYFSDGLTEEMITQLGGLQTQRFGVIARTSAVRYKHSQEELGLIGRELGVQYVLEGSVRQSSGRVRVAARLIRVSDQTHIWAQTYDRESRDILSLQGDVARAIAEKIQLELTPTEAGRLAAARPVNPGTYEAYLKGRYFWNKRTSEGLKKSIEYFEQAIGQDSNFAAAYAGLADSYSILGSDVLPADVARSKARAAANSALELDPTIAEGHAALALVELYDWSWRQSEEEFQHAIQLNPNYASAHQWYSYYLTAMGRFEEAIQEAKQAQQIDPLSLAISTTLASRYYYAHQYDQAIQLNQRTLELDPNFVPAHSALGSAYEAKGMWQEAIDEYRKAVDLSQDSPAALALLGHVYGLSGNKEEARKIVDRLEKLSTKSYVSSFDVATVFTVLGDRDSAFWWLEKSYSQRESQMPFLKVNQRLDPLRSDPRFQDLLRRVGLPP